MVVLTASATVIYQVLIGKILAMMALIGISGLFVSFIVLIKMKNIKEVIDRKINELEDVI